MARARYSLCGTFCLCVCFFVCIGINDAVSNINDRYYYETDSRHHRIEHSLHIELLKEEELHNHQKRDVESSQITVSSTPIPTNSSEKLKPLRLPKATLAKPPDNPPLKQIHNLGVNGTGQRQNFTVVQEQSSLFDNIGTSVNTAIRTADEDLPHITPSELTPDDDEDDDEDISDEDEFYQKELHNHNITDYKTDTHIFYNSTTYNDPVKGNFFWVDMDKRSDVKVHELLSSSHRRAATVKLSFEFPFYGRYITNVTVATGGFLYTGNYVHSWLAATQYIAPLMANFDTALSNDSFVKYVDNGTAFTVEWEKVALQDKPTNEFTFQVTLHENGDIVFVYKNVPLVIKDINDQHHPVKVGLSDAYILDRTVFYVRRKTIYEYHRVAFNKEEIKNWTSIYLKALPTCLDLLNCSSCLTNDLNLNCTWCPSLKQCSTGLDRNRQFWIDTGCEKKNITTENKCSMSFDEDKALHLNDSLNYNVEDPNKFSDEDYIGRLPRQTPFGAVGYMVIFLVVVIAGFGLWTGYAYKNPHTTSGQMLIRYRPSQWRWRRGEARYTAATIHM